MNSGPYQWKKERPVLAQPPALLKETGLRQRGKVPEELNVEGTRKTSVTLQSLAGTDESCVERLALSETSTIVLSHRDSIGNSFHDSLLNLREHPHRNEICIARIR